MPQAKINQIPLPLPGPATFRTVKAAIIAQILGGAWGPGTLLPGEVELAAAYGCSRTTINRAMREVSDLGLVERRRKAGTRVRLVPVRQARFVMPLVRAEVEAEGAVYGYSLLGRDHRPLPDGVAKRLGLDPAGGLLHLTCLHLADHVPYQVEERWINTVALPQASAQDFTDIGPNEWLVAEVPFSDVEISFLARAADPAMAVHLQMAVGEPVFCMERTTWWQGAAITHVRLSYRRGHRMTTRY